MGKSCTINPCCKNLKGEIVESKLFKDLLHYTSNNRPIAIEYYGVGTNDRFLNEVKDEAKFDENGQITVGSLKKLAKLDFKEDSLLDTLNKDIQSGVGTYEDVMPRLQQFNRTNPFRDDYMATIELTDDNNYKLSVVKRTTKNEEALNKEIAHRNLRDRLIYYLNKNGVNVTFLEESDNIKGRYNTRNIEQTADGLYNLIQLLKGENMDSSLAEEAGHFAIGALGNDVLVERLINLLTPEVQQSILGEEYNTKVMSSNPARETAGYLVGKALNKESINDFPGSNLLNRIINKVKKIFYKITGDDIKLAKLQAESIAEDIAKGFISPNFKGTIENAISTKETLYDADKSEERVAYEKVVGKLKSLTETLKTKDTEFAKRLEDIINSVEKHFETARPTTSEYLLKGFAMSGLTEAIVKIQSLLENDIPNLLDETNTAEYKYTFLKDLPNNAKNLFIVRNFVSDTLSIIETIKGLNIAKEAEIIPLDTSNGITMEININKVADTIAEALQKGKIVTRLATKERDLFLNFLKRVLGKEYVEETSRVVFNINTPKGSENKGRWARAVATTRDIKIKSLLKMEEGGIIKLDNLLLYLKRDSSLFERYLASASNSSDIVLQLVDKYVKQQNKLGDDKINKIQDRLRVLQAKLKDLNLKNTNVFMEVSNRPNDKNNYSITGNIVSPLCWGDYENDFQAFKIEKEKEFLKKYPNIATLPDTLQAIYWADFFTPLVKKWHKGGVIQDENGNDVIIEAHSQWDAKNKRYIPSGGIATKKGFKSVDYTSKQYKDNIEGTELENWLNEYMELKEELDSYLPEGSTLSIRAPQFKGSFNNKLQNRRIGEGDIKAYKHTLRESIRSTFCEDFDDTELGSDLTVNTVSNDAFSNELEFEKEKVNRIPLFGINKLKDPNDLSTDLFHSTLAYASMAITYNVLNSSVDILEVGRTVLSRRTYNNLTETERASLGKGNTNSFARYKTFLDKQIYGIGARRINVGDIVLNKVINFITALGSKLYLYGNVVGGVVNLGTGFFELLKEAITNENYSLEDFKKANGVYIKSLLFRNISPNKLGQIQKDDKLSLLLRHFNIQGDNKERQRNWNTREKRIVHFLKTIGWSPYRNGDNYMQSMSYLALFNRTKLYDSEGNEHNMEDAYDYSDIIDEDGVTKDVYGKTLTLKENQFFLSKENLEEYKFAKALLEKVSNAIDKGTTYNFTDEELDYIRSKNWTYNKFNQDILKDRLQDAVSRLTYNAYDEADLMNKAREISNRLHGIYNTQDKVGLNQNILGNMWLSMKGYALGMVERRFGANKYNALLGHNVEGSVNSAVKFTIKAFQDKEYRFLARTLFLPFSNSVHSKMTKMGFSDNQYYNMRRNALDMYLLTALFLLQLLTSLGLSDEGDDDDDLLLGNSNYLFYRWYLEQSAFNLPWEFAREMYSYDVLPTGVSAALDLGYMTLGVPLSLVSSPDEDNIFNFLYYKKSKEGLYEVGDYKPFYRIEKAIPFWKSYLIYEHPVQAKKGFEFFRDERNI